MDEELTQAGPPDDPYDIDLSGALTPTVKDTTAKKPVSRNMGAPVSTLWDTILSAPKNTARAVGRGALQAANEASNTAASAVLGISKGTGAYKLGRTPEQRKQWLANYEKETDTQNPFQFSEDAIEWATGAKQEGLFGVVEGVAQFATGMVATGGALKALGVAQKVSTLGKAGKVGAEMVKGGIVDGAFFEAHQQRLSDAVSGTFLESFISRLFASEDDDSAVVGRLKNVGEGMVLGGTMELMIGGVRAARAWKKGDKEGAARTLAEAEAKAATPAATDVATVAENEAGKFEVWTPMELTRPAAVPEFATRAEAEANASAINMIHKNNVEGHDPSFLVDEVDVDAWRKVREVMDSGGDPRDAAEILEDLGYNPKYDQSPEEQQNVLRALVQTHLEPSTVARARVESWEETAAKAMDLGMGKTPAEAMAQASKLYDNTTDLASHLFLARTNLQILTNQAHKLSRAADLNPHDGDIALALSDALRGMVEFHAHLSGATSSVGRALQAQKMPVGKEAIETVEASTKRKVLSEKQTAALKAAREARSAAAAEKEAAKAAQAAADAKLPTKTGTGAGSQLRDTDGLTAAEWSMARAVKKAVKALSLGGEDAKALDFDVEMFASMKRTADVLKNQNLPQGPVAKPSKNGSVNPTEELSKWMDKVEAELDKVLNPKVVEDDGIIKTSQRTNITPMDKLFDAASATEEGKRFAWSSKVPVEKGKPTGNPADRLLNLLNGAEHALEKELNKPAGWTSSSGPITPMDQLVKRLSVTDGLSAAEIRDLARATFMTDQDPARILTALRGLNPEQIHELARTILSVKGDPISIKSVLEGLNAAEVRDLARTISAIGEDPERIQIALKGMREAKVAETVLDKSWAEKARDFALTWRMEAMLSAPPTHIGNIVSNTMAMMQRPVEHWWAGVRLGDKKMQQFAIDMASPVGMWADISDSMGALSKAMKTGVNVLDPSDPHQLGQLIDTGGLKETGVGMWDAVKVLGRAPTRLLMSSDEFFKQMNYRRNVRAQILRQARESGITDSKELMQRLQDQGRWSFNPDGSAANPWALDYARVSTFTNPLGEGTLGQTLQNAANDHWVVRLIVPFVKTPVNIFRYAHERTPVLRRFSVESRAALKSGDPQRIALTKAKAEIGGMFWTVGALLASNKVITGGGPTDPGLRAELKEAGWQPYSIRIGDRYASFRRGDPVFTAFSVVADLVEMSGDMNEVDFGDAVNSTMAAVAASVTSKSFMQGFSDFFDAVSAGSPNKMDNLVSNTLGSFIPNALRRLDPNPYIMETQGLVEELKARVPGFSTTLEPKRNLFGKPVLRPPGLAGGVDNMFNPFTISGKVPDENVFNELVKLGKSIPMPPESLQNGTINLRDTNLFDDRKRADGRNQSPYDRWLELIGEGGIEADVIGALKDEEYPDMPDEVKLAFIGGIVKDHQDEAFEKLVVEYPQLQEALGMADELKGAAREGGNAVQSVLERHSKVFVKQKRRPNVAIPDAKK